MFTGLIQSLGTIRPLGGDRFSITCSHNSSDAILQDLATGDSVAVDGVCLTVTEVLPQGFVATASPETLRRTTLGQQFDRLVNVETALRVGSKLGGHFVMGHVDGVGCLQTVEQTATSWEMAFTAPDEIARYIVPKGSIAVNGVSLTIADWNPAINLFKVAVIPLSYAETNLQYLGIGNWVNLEGDILGKYVEKLIQFGTDRGEATSPLDTVSPTFLAEHGYL
ncbi:riboflavin synthase [Gloeocapsopsis dulcis]|uniref:Riboflavin synthase n=1 Tax=Gloeocapsopsis dulcis AAB1 = 1H9 TaxID=1433147 RepID=A0A6N8FSC6_9CHRO|nr:riboflavin synthase [Gloeocapsopsis dulcis]MUL35462.1 riboflavin synthase [Gloeocapsopsis dulcis AAB1 = 1H9]WNN90340.1 riboflavin synthase [Gloeocapsopsis dulcis]